MTPQDDHFILRLEQIALQKRSAISGIPNQPVSAAREEFEQALRDAEGDSPNRHPQHPEDDSKASLEPQPELAPLEGFEPLALPESYGPDGDMTHPSDLPRLDLEG